MFRYHSFKAWFTTTAGACGVFWSAISLVLIGSVGYFQLAGVYVLYLALNLAQIRRIQREPFSPRGLVSILTFVAFGFSIPMFAAGVSFSGSYVVRYTETDYVNATLAVITMQLAFLLGIVLAENSFTTSRQRHAGPLKDPTPLGLLSFTGLVAVACLFRVRFHLGEAGTQPSIPFAGVFQYLFYNGAILVAAWQLARCLNANQAKYMLSFLPFLVIACTQAYMGWRGAVFKLIFAILLIHWFQDRIPFVTRPKSFHWLLVGVLAAFAFVQLGNSRRAERLGGESRFAQSVPHYLDKVWYRAQGTNRLAPVIRHFGGISLFNRAHFFELRRRGISAVRYVDSRLYGIAASRSHSQGGSGPGTAFVHFGLAGIVVTYTVLGIALGASYRAFHSRGTTQPDFVAMSLYISFGMMCMYAIPENSEVLNWLVALVLIAVALKITESLFLRMPISVTPYGAFAATTHHVDSREAKGDVEF